MPHLSFLFDTPKFVLELPDRKIFNKISLSNLTSVQNGITNTEAIHMRLENFSDNEFIDRNRNIATKYFHSNVLLTNNIFSYCKVDPYPWDYEGRNPLELNHLKVEMVKANGEPFSVAEWGITKFYCTIYYE